MSDAVLVGRVVSNRDTIVSGELLATPEDTLRLAAAAVRLRVIKGWKDPGADEVQVVDIAANSSCADYLPEGQIVIVYAKRIAGTLVTRGCGAERNRPLTYARRDLTELGPYQFSRSKR